jgi:hypothetical protein
MQERRETKEIVVDLFALVDWSDREQYHLVVKRETLSSTMVAKPNIPWNCSGWC